MSEIIKDYPLRDLNTFKIDVRAAFFATAGNEEEFRNLIGAFPGMPRLVLGGGSNILFSQNFDGLVIKNEIKGISVIDENNENAVVEAGAGEIWDDLVAYCVGRNYGGLENLTLIPGSVGASPVQNIGAYGVEIKDVFEKLTGINTLTGKAEVFDRNGCRFGYRDSIFKRDLKNKFIITRVCFRLSKNPVVNISYDAIRAELLKSGNENPGIKDISNIVREIRESKLPDPKVTGNAGSFFKNPEITEDKFAALQGVYPDIPGYPAGNGAVKIAAGWLIQKCGWKGKSVGNAGVYEKQALVLVNLGNATGREIIKLSEEIKKSVLDKFSIQLETEVNII